MSSRIPLQIISTNTTPDDYSSSSMMYKPYCNCCYYDNQSMLTENYYPTYEMNYNSNSLSIDSKKKSKRQSKHIPHHLRPQHIVERRNQRERLRVQDVNQAFHILQQLLPLDSTSIEDSNMTQNNSSRISKVRTLRKAVDYIEALQNMLNENN